MSLYGNSEHEVLLFCRIHGIFNMLCQNTVFCPTIFCYLKNIHELFTCVAVKAHIVKYIGAAIEVSSIIMECMRTITKLFQCSCRTFCLRCLQYCFIWIFSRSKVTHTHSRQYFEFRICCSCPYGRSFEISGRIFFHQLSEIRDRIFRCREELYFVRIKKGFQLDEYNIRHIFSAGRNFCNLPTFGDFRHHLLIIITWLRDSGIKHTC